VEPARADAGVRVTQEHTPMHGLATRNVVADAAEHRQRLVGGRCRAAVVVRDLAYVRDVGRCQRPQVHPLVLQVIGRHGPLRGRAPALAAYALPMSEDVTARLTQAIELAARNVAAGGGPFGAIVVTPDGRVFEGVNRVTTDNDPTAHAEVTAIRTACRALGTFDLSGCVLYASCEPCPMCLASALWARVDRVYFAADRHDAARAGFDDAVFYDYFEGRGGPSLMPVERVRVAASGEPVRAWEAFDGRVEY